MYFKDFFTQIRGRLKDNDADAAARLKSAELGRAAQAGIRKIQTLFPEVRMDVRGHMRPLFDTLHNETTARQKGEDGQLPSIPLPPEFEPALVAFVMAWAYGREASDAKDESLLRHWDRRFMELTGAFAR